MAKHTSMADLRGRTDEDLVTFVRVTTKGLLDARFENYANRLNDTSKVAHLRRELARALTVQSERRRVGAVATATVTAKGEVQ